MTIKKVRQLNGEVGTRGIYISVGTRGEIFLWVTCPAENSWSEVGKQAGAIQSLNSI